MASVCRETKKPSSKPTTRNHLRDYVGCTSINLSEDTYSFELLTLHVSNCLKKILTSVYKKWYNFDSDYYTRCAILSLIVHKQK